jgi:uncharacterized protein (TIGR02118 family)
MARVKIVGFWTAPTDPADIPAFEADYMENHVPIAARLPGLVRLGTIRVDSGWQGAEPEHYRIVEAEFESREALEASFSTSEFAAMRADRQRLIDTYGVSNRAEMGEVVLADLADERGASDKN